MRSASLSWLALLNHIQDLAHSPRVFPKATLSVFFLVPLLLLSCEKLEVIFVVVGQCYVDGLMFGEWLKSPKSSLQKFVLR
jgi:hypothetical protein